MRCLYENVTILYADDATAARSYYAEFLGHLFCTVYEACDGEEAWQLYQKYRPDILLLDVEMPEINGLELAERIREDDKRTRIIIATAYINEKRLLQAVELGLTRFLPKPFGRRSFRETLEKAVLELDGKHFVELGGSFRWNSSKRELLQGEEPVKLTANEKALLTLLGSKPDTLFSTYMIEEHLWPFGTDDDSASRLKALIKRIRKKLPEGCITNVYGEGYRINSVI